MEKLKEMALKVITRCVECVRSTWERAPLPTDFQRQYQIRSLRFSFEEDDDVQQNLDIAVITCPKVCHIELTLNTCTRAMLRSLAKFRELGCLELHLATLDLEIGQENYGIGLGNLCFGNLEIFWLSDCKDGWVSSGYLFEMLAMCPNLEKFGLACADGFSNKIASELADKMANTKLKSIMFCACELLGEAGIEDLLRIPSLVELKAYFHVSEMYRQHFDVLPLQRLAETCGVELTLSYH